jgi:hypothetical protein
MHIKLILTMTVISVGTLTVAALPSVAAESDNKQKTISELKSLEDPTILLPRVWLDSEWNKFRDENSTLEETLGGLWAWRLSAEQEWAVRVKIPVTMSFAGDTVDDSNRTALGDIKVATGTAFRLSNTLRAGSGIELRMPSGTDDTLSDNTWRLQEFGTIAWDITPWLTLSPTFEHNHSVAEQSGASPKHFLELYFPATILLPDDWAVTLRYETKFDFQNDNAYTHSAKFQVAKRLDAMPLGLALSVEKPLESGDDKDFQINFLSTYYLPSD